MQNYFRKKAPPKMFLWALNASLETHTLWILPVARLFPDIQIFIYLFFFNVNFGTCDQYICEINESDPIYERQRVDISLSVKSKKVSCEVPFLNIDLSWWISYQHVNPLFFLSGFLSRPFTNNSAAGEGGGHFCNSSLPLPPD